MSRSLRGKCLVASPNLRDQNFYKTVVLVIEHGSHGAMGIVINRPSSILVSHALAKHFDLPGLPDLVFMGGPVEPEALLVLHNIPDLTEGETEISPGVLIGSSPDSFEEVMRKIAGQMEGLKFRIYSGCAGWAPQQLEGELAQGDWLPIDAPRDIPYHEDPYEIYPMLLQRVFEEHRILPHPDTDPQWN